MSYTLSQYATHRDALLQHMITFLQTDERFVAAWLVGSFGRNEGDALSDLDLRVVIADAYVEQLCTCAAEPQTQITSSERLALYNQFGSALVLREDASINPTGGCFNHVVYRNTAATVDWVLLPQAIAQRPRVCRMLFSEVELPLEPEPQVESLEERIKLASRDIGLFWLMMGVACKYMLRNDEAALYGFLSGISYTLHEVRRYVTVQLPDHRSDHLPFATTLAEQVALIRKLCHEMLTLMSLAVAMGASVPEDPMSVIEVWLSMASHRVQVSWHPYYTRRNDITI